MIKKIVVYIFLFFSFFIFSQDITFGICEYEGDIYPGKAIENCIGGKESKLYDGGDLKVENGFKKTISKWIGNLALYLGILTVFAMVYSTIMISISSGEEEKIKKAKNIFKWAFLGFILIMLAAAIVTLIINILYDL